ncbi:hypothetical protein NP233_g9827 [Leucocoprinus birnbaumii]|uniref:Uncharacterized protein n=1 Tax=Leucocoprinus birnbaumii TaxID=56174 RepID=A0AAD5VJY3_9AGAR|nr:hypothetical protein NP233_g9827 [Leucocoprinus birnbaumii]
MVATASRSYGAGGQCPTTNFQDNQAPNATGSSPSSSQTKARLCPWIKPRTASEELSVLANNLRFYLPQYTSQMAVSEAEIPPPNQLALIAQRTNVDEDTGSKVQNQDIFESQTLLGHATSGLQSTRSSQSHQCKSTQSPSLMFSHRNSPTNISTKPTILSPARPIVESVHLAREYPEANYRLFTPGITRFDPNSYVQKAHLTALLSIVSRAQVPDNRVDLQLGGVDNVKEELTTFSETLRLTFDNLLQLVIGGRQRDHEDVFKQGKQQSRIACIATTAFFANCNHYQRAEATNIIQGCVLRILDCLDAEELLVYSTELLHLCWFLIEISIRAQALPDRWLSNGFTKDIFALSAKRLIGYLLHNGTRKSVEEIRIAPGGAGFSSMITQSWVSLVHLFRELRFSGLVLHGDFEEPFWDVFVRYLPQGLISTSAGLQDIWKAVADIQVLSCFTPRGIACGAPHVGHSWRFITYLVQQSVPPLRYTTRLIPRDEAIDNCLKTAISQCSELTNRGWPLHGSIPTIIAILEIFKRRGYTCLCQEDALFSSLIIPDLKSFVGSQIRSESLTVFLRVLTWIKWHHRSGTLDPAHLRSVINLLVPSTEIAVAHPGIEQPHERAAVYQAFASSGLALVIAGDDQSSKTIIDRLKGATRGISITGEAILRKCFIKGLGLIADCLIRTKRDIAPLATWIQSTVSTAVTDYEAAKARARNDPLKKVTSMGMFDDIMRSLYDLALAILSSYEDVRKFPEAAVLVAFIPLLDCTASNIRLLKHGDMVNSAHNFLVRLQSLFNPSSAKAGSYGVSPEGIPHLPTTALVRAVILPCFDILKAQIKEDFRCVLTHLGSSPRTWESLLWKIRSHIADLVAFLAILGKRKIITDDLLQHFDSSFLARGAPEWLSIFVKLIGYGEIRQSGHVHTASRRQGPEFVEAENASDQGSPTHPGRWKKPAQKLFDATRETYAQNVGLLLIVGSQMFFSLMNVAVKKLNSIDPPVTPLQLIVVRMGITWVFSVVYMLATGVPHPFIGPPGVRGIFVFRGLAGFVGLMGIYFSLQYLSLSDATVLTFLVPLFISLFGVVLIARPPFIFGDTGKGTIGKGFRIFAGEVTPEQRLFGVGMALLNVLGATGAYTSLRAIGKRAHPLHSLSIFSFYSIIGASIGMIMAETPFVIPTRPEWLAMLVMIGIFGFFAQILLTMGLARETASRGALGMYSQVVFAGILERIFFHTIPSGLSLAGTLLIVSCALFIALTKAKPAGGGSGKDVKKGVTPRDVEDGILEREALERTSDGIQHVIITRGKAYERNVLEASLTTLLLPIMTSPYPNFSTPLTFANTTVQSPAVPPTPTPVGRGRPRGSGTGAKRGRKPKNPLGTNSPRVASPAPGSSAAASPIFSAPQYQQVQWAANTTGDDGEGSLLQGEISRRNSSQPQVVGTEQGEGAAGAVGGSGGVDGQTLVPGPSGSVQPLPVGTRPPGMDEDADVDDELLPAMADDDYSAQQDWNTQSKDNLKILMDSFSGEQYERFEAYRRHALPKQAVRKVSIPPLVNGSQPTQLVHLVLAGGTAKLGPASVTASGPNYRWLLEGLCW